MEKALFLLPDWLAVGAAVIVFAGIGLLIGKWIWGRQGSRLSRAVDENMNLLSQWAALGETQHVLFKKLRTRWQADRDSWGEQTSVWSKQLRGKDKAIRKLIAKVKRLKEESELNTSKAGEQAIAERDQEISGLEKRVEAIESELQDAYAEMADVRAGYLARAEAVRSLESGLTSRQVSGAESVDLEESNLQLSVLLRQRSIETARLRQFSQKREVVEPISAFVESDTDETLELRKQLDEAVGELSDIRSKHEDRAGEIRILENRLEDMQSSGSAQQGKSAGYLDEIKDLRDELGDVRRGYHSKVREIESLRGAAEELESIIEDRNREIEDSGKELKGQLKVISTLRSSIAELEGELDGQDVESVDLVAELKEKSEQVQFLNDQMKSLEEAMAERYAEVNKVRAEWAQIENRADRYSAESERLAKIVEEQDVELKRLSAELNERVTEIEPLNQGLREAREKLDRFEIESNAVRSELEEKELSLAVAEEGALRLRKALHERTSELEKAQDELSTLKSELKERVKTEEERKVELEDALSRLDEYDESLARRDKSIQGMEETVDRIEAEADSLKILLEEGRRNTVDLESKIIEFEDLIESKNSEIGVFTREIRNLVESVDAPDRDDGESGSGGSRTGEIDRLLEGGSDDVAGEATRVHIRILTDTVADLQNRLVEAEGSYGACEREKALINEKNDTVREQFNVELRSRDKQIQILKHEVSAQQAKLEELRKRATAEIEPSQRVVVAEKEVVVAETVAGVRNTAPATEVESNEKELKQRGENIWVSVHFEEKSFELKAAELAKIDEAARSIRRSGASFRVDVSGFSSLEGSSDYNEVLSARRADAVRERLIDVGVAQSNISTQGQGEHPDYAKSSHSWKARRVELAFVSEMACEAVS